MASLLDFLLKSDICKNQGNYLYFYCFSMDKRTGYIYWVGDCNVMYIYEGRGISIHTVSNKRYMYWLYGKLRESLTSK